MTNLIIFFNFRSYFATVASELALNLNKVGRRFVEAYVELVNESSYTFYLKKKEHNLLTYLFSIQFQLKECCNKTYSEISSNVEYIIENSLKNQLYWFSIRQFKITGSRCYSIFTYS